MPNAYHYTALAGDTFDSIALDFYDKEQKSSVIIQANLQYRKVITFIGGEVLQIPILETEAATTLPPWKQA
ncbi:hypothetical protein [Gorillibacterium massiliense]|uniref:hypothetical protein n=1 Tax=Gorillibacterium massiliense TaxID=1280390 RepID=UPI0004BBD3D1|nr:hypothetical protein [Gorillibacterium massiliense]